jgi:hypothetical protein
MTHCPRVLAVQTHGIQEFRNPDAITTVLRGLNTEPSLQGISNPFPSLTGVLYLEWTTSALLCVTSIGTPYPVASAIVIPKTLASLVPSTLCPSTGADIWASIDHHLKVHFVLCSHFLLFRFSCRFRLTENGF